jgi:glutathione peroxidase-family protein
MTVGPMQMDVLNMLSNKITIMNGGTHRILHYLRQRANNEENVSREDVKWLLVKFSIPVDIDDREKFADIFDPERTDKIHYKTLLNRIAPDVFDWDGYKAMLANR